MPNSYDNSDVQNMASYGNTFTGGSGQTQQVPQSNVLSQIGKGISQIPGQVSSMLNKPKPKVTQAGGDLDPLGNSIVNATSTNIGSPGSLMGYAAGGGYSGGTMGGMSNFTDPARANKMQGNLLDPLGNAIVEGTENTPIGQLGSALGNMYGQVLPQSNVSVIPVNKNNAAVVQQMYRPQQNKKGETQDVYRMVASQYNVSKKPGVVTLDKEGILNSFSPQDKAAISSYMYNTNISYLDKIDFVLQSSYLDDKQKAAVLALIAHQEGDQSNILVVHDGSKGGFSVLQFDSVKDKRDFKSAYYGLGKNAPFIQKQYYDQTKKTKQPKRK